MTDPLRPRRRAPNRRLTSEEVKLLDTERGICPSEHSLSSWPFALFLAVGCLFLWRVVFAGQVLVPATLLRYVAPWQHEARPPWNPLMYDSVGQFYPWRHFAAQTVHSGRLPLWNPYQFCGTPFVANSQSAVFYPGNLLFYLLPTDRAFGWSALLHLVFAASFTYLLLRALGLTRTAASFGGLAYAFSAWQVSWLELPTFLCTSCWLPLVLLLTYRLFQRPRGSMAVGLGFAVGMTLLAGHLQVAFYTLLAVLVFAAWLAVRGPETRSADLPPSVQHQARRPAMAALALFVCALALGASLAAPQLLPALELSHRSHRTGPPTSQGYAAYTDYAVSPKSLVTLFVPDYFNNPSNPAGPYFGTSRGGMYFNYAEGALYVGLLPLLLAVVAAVRARRGPRTIGYLLVLAALALLMALGTQLDAALYFWVPGFGQSGSPGRALVLWAFAISGLAAFGLDGLLRQAPGSVRVVALSAGVIAAAAVLLCAVNDGGVTALQLPEGQWQPKFPQQISLLVLAAGCALALAAGRLKPRWRSAAPIALLTVDLFAAGGAYNLTSAPAEVYPSTPKMAALRQQAGHDRIMPINRGWSFGGPKAVLPPDGAMVFGLHDVQGYDSLFPGQYKAFMNALDGEDASPPEVGNMVFAKRPDSALVAQLGVRYVLMRDTSSPAGADGDNGMSITLLPGTPGRASAVTQDGRPATVEWLEDSPTRVRLAVTATGPAVLTVADEIYPGWTAAVDGETAPISRANDIFRRVQVPAGRHIVSFTYQPGGFRVGLYLMLAVLGIGVFVLGYCMAVMRAYAPSRTSD